MIGPRLPKARTFAWDLMHLIQPTGHSLGGALATLAAYDIAAALESIGLPTMSLSVRFIPNCGSPTCRSIHI